MKFVVSTLLALAAVAQAGVVRFENEGVTNHDIDLLIKDAIITNEKYWEANQPFPYGTFPVLPMKSYNVQLKNTTFSNGKMKSFSEASSKNNNHLSFNVDVTQENVRIEGDIAITGHGVNEEGTFKLTYPVAGQKIGLAAHFDKKSIKITKLNVIHYQDVSTISNYQLEISGVKVQGMTKEELEKNVRAVVEKFRKKQQNAASAQLPTIKDNLNREMEGYNLQQVYNYLRKQVPRS